MWGPRREPGPPVLQASDVELLYRQMLGRPPAHEEVAHQVESGGSWQELLAVIADSDEFRRRVTPVEPADPQRVINFHTAEDTTRFQYQPGTISADGSSMMGTAGHIFLVSGTNSILDQFTGQYSLPEDWEQRWRETIDARAEAASALGIQLHMLTVPDKLAVAPEHFPDALVPSGPRPTERLLEMFPQMIYPVLQLRACEGDAALRTDTHLTPVGNRALGAVLSTELGVDLLGDTELESSPYLISGDLGSKFNPPVVEVAHSGDGFGSAELVADSSERFFSKGLHVGVRQHLRNRRAPDSRTVLIFGDSYARAAAAYRGVAWYLAQGFANTHLVWIPYGWDTGVVKQLGADVVISQGAERFVTRVPSNAVDLQPYD